MARLLDEYPDVYDAWIERIYGTGRKKQDFQQKREAGRQARITRMAGRTKGRRRR